MAALVVCGTKEGNTDKLAQAIADAVQAEVKILPQEIDSARYDFIFAGFFCDRGRPDENFQEFFQKIGDKPCAVFGTIGGDPTQGKGAQFVERLRQNGFTAPHVKGFKMWQGMPAATMKRVRLPNSEISYPTEEACTEAGEWARKILSEK